MQDINELKITEAEKARLLIKNANNRPNAMATYGQAKKSSSDVKDMFDQQFEFVVERFNKLCDAKSEEQSEIIVAEQSRVTAEKNREAAEKNREAAEVKRETAVKEATKRANDISQTLEYKLENGEFKGEQGPQGIQGPQGDDGYTPKKTIDYWTQEDVNSMESILRAKAANIGGFVPVNAPLLDHLIDLNKTTVTVTGVVENADGTHTVVFNRVKNEFTDGGFEQYHSNESIVPLNSFSKGENGWTGLNFGVENSGNIRIAEVRKAQYSGDSHSGDSYIEVWGRYSSLCKSLKLKPFTDYTLSFWVKGPVPTAAINNISVMAKAYDGDVLYTSVGGAYWRDIDNSNYEKLYNGGYESIPNAVIQNANVWQECKIDFRTASNEYVDIFIYFGDNSWQYFYFDDFSVIENVEPEFAATYNAGVEVPPEVAVGSVFYVERDNGRAFTRFEYASSFAIKELYKYTEELNRAAFEDLTKEIGDISSALDELHTYAQSLIGGNA